MKIAILGFGLEGKSVLKYLKKSPQFKNAAISILDQKLDKNYLKNLSDFDIVYRSPGVPYNLPEIQKAIKNGVKFSSVTKLFFEQIGKIVRRGSPQVIGVAGTKGKGTTATLFYKILKNCFGKRKVFLAGNIGKSALEILPRLKKNSLIILELSSFQLQDMKVSPPIAVVLDIFPDHLDSHKNFNEYVNAESNIAKWQKKNDKVFYFSNNKYSKLIAQKSHGEKNPVSTKNFNLFKKDDLRIPGEHNFKNAVIAATAALSLGCPKEKILKVVKNFKSNEHRLELIRIIRINQSNQHKSTFIKFYNDSASTNPQAAAVAIAAFKEPKTRALKTLSARPSTKRTALSALVLIAGGKDKNLNYAPLARALKNSNTKLIVLFGENKRKIYKAISGQRLVVRKVKTLKDAVNLAYKFTKSLIAKSSSLIAKPYTLNVIIIFSPASTSFDMFKDYADRGKKFKELVRKLKR